MVPMLEREFDTEERTGESWGFKEVLGYLLVILGAAIAIWVFLNVCRVFNSPEKLTEFRGLVPGSAEAVVSTSDSNGVKVIVPAEVLSLFIAIFLLAVAAGIAGVFINGGTRLLDGDIQRITRRVSAAASTLGDRIGRLEEILRRDRSQH